MFLLEKAMVLLEKAKDNCCHVDLQTILLELSVFSNDFKKTWM